MTSLKNKATETTSYNVLCAIKQIMLNFIDAPLVQEFFPNGWINDISEKELQLHFVRVENLRKLRHQKRQL